MTYAEDFEESAFQRERISGEKDGITVLPDGVSVIVRPTFPVH